MSKTTAVKTNRIVYIAALISVLGFAAFSVKDDISQGNQGMNISIGISAVTFIMLIILHRLDRFVSEAFSIPMTLYVMYMARCLVTDNFAYFFPTCLAIYCGGALYLNRQKLLLFIVISNIISIVLLALKIPLVRMQNGLTQSIAFSEVLVNWFLSFIGSIYVFIGVIVVTDKTAVANQTHDSFTALLTSTPNLTALVDSLNRVTYISKPLMHLIGLKYRKDIKMVLGRPILDLFDDPDFKKLLYDILSRSGSFEETRKVTINGKEYYFEIMKARLFNETKGWLLNLIDITPIMKAKLEAEAASESKSSFLATMSHEIRTPLNAIIGLSEIELQKKLPMETRLDMEKIYTSGANLLSIINDILDLSKIEAGSFDLIPMDYDVPSLVNDTIHLNIVRIGSKQIVFKLEIDDTIPIKLFGDEVRVRQILNNFLSNAFKYTKEGTVVLKITWERRENNAWVSFSVSDTGRGIKPEDLSRLFEEYTQFDARANRHIEGTGLGLSITKNLVELMGGSISVESEYGKGSVFTVTFPQRIVDDSPIGEATANNLRLFRFMENRRNRALNLIRAYMPYGKVLVVDDVETNLDVARGLMLPYGLFIDCATSGPEAIGKIRAAADDTGPRYDLVLMDHMMPGMDGIEAVRIIRGEIDNEYARTVPIVALTANALAGNEEMFLSCGFNAFISKPIDIMQLDVALNTWVKDKQSRQTLLQVEMAKAAQDEETAPKDAGVLDGLSVEGLDLAQGCERYNSEAVYLDVLRSYHKHTPAQLEKLRAMTGDISLAEYTVTVHGLKGSSYGICAGNAGREAEALESAARAGDLERVLADNIPFIEKVELLLRNIGELLEKAETAKGVKQKIPAPEKELLDQLLDAVKRYKTSAMDEILGKLESHEYETGGDLVVWLREQIDNLEYDAIRERLENNKNK
jgi:PAS domain S-box-containing protein